VRSGAPSARASLRLGRTRVPALLHGLYAIEDLSDDRLLVHPSLVRVLFGRGLHQFAEPVGIFESVRHGRPPIIPPWRSLAPRARWRPRT